MFYLVGLGLFDEKDISLKGLECLKNVDKIYAICGICDNVKCGNSVVAKEGANKIKIGTEVYPK